MGEDGDVYGGDQPGKEISEESTSAIFLQESTPAILSPSWFILKRPPLLICPFVLLLEPRDQRNAGHTQKRNSTASRSTSGTLHHSLGHFPVPVVGRISSCSHPPATPSA